MYLIDPYGHEELRAHLARRAADGTLPASLLLQGPRGVGKQRLALWLAQTLLCERVPRPCGSCRNCKYSRSLTHPDLHWYFPRPRLKDADPDLADVRDDHREAIAERVANGGLYPPTPGTDGIYVATVRAIVQEAAISPAIASRKVFVIGEADRMVPQEGSEYAANAFLKLLEEPSQNTNLILTSSEPGSLLPTIRSRTVTVRVPLLSESAVRGFLADPLAAAAVGAAGVGDSIDRVILAAGAPGNLLGDESRGRALTAARRLLEAARAKNDSVRHAVAMSVGASGSRGIFSEILDALIIVLGERMRAALHANDERGAAGASRAAEAVGRARLRASGNVNPQLITARLLRELSSTL